MTVAAAHHDTAIIGIFRPLLEGFVEDFVGGAVKALLIINPVAGQSRPQEALAAIGGALAPLVAETLVTQGRGDAEAAARRAAHDREFDAVLVAGGDGTINEAINGLLAGSAPGAPPLPLGLISLGTQNVLAHELSLPRDDLDALARVIRAGHTRAIDVGRVGERYFSLMAGFGFDAAVVRDVALPVKELIGSAAYALATMSALAAYRSTSVQLSLDGETITSEAYLIVVANASSYALRHVKLAPFAAIDDGWLDVCVFERAPLDKVGFVTQIMAMLARRHLRDPRVRYYRARHIGIVSNPPIQGQLDGDMFGETPLTLEVVPKALTLFVP